MRALLACAAVFVCGAVHAQSYFAVDLYNRKVHVANGANVKRPVGGLAKIAAALVVLDWSDVTKVNLNVLATVSPTALQATSAAGL